MSRVIAIIARAMSFLGSGWPLPRSATWQYSQLTPSAVAIVCMVAERSARGACAAQVTATARRRGTGDGCFMDAHVAVCQNFAAGGGPRDGGGPTPPTAFRRNPSTRND